MVELTLSPCNTGEQMALRRTESFHRCHDCSDWALSMNDTMFYTAFKWLRKTYELDRSRTRYSMG